MRVPWNRQQGIHFQADTDNTVYRIHHPGKPHQGPAVPFHFLHGVDGFHPLLSGCAFSNRLIGVFIASLILLFVVSKLFDKLEENPNFDLVIAGAGILLSVVLLAYATFKSYPMDYDSAGKLILSLQRWRLTHIRMSNFQLAYSFLG